MQEERRMILKMIEDGKISAEEGMRLLESLRDEKKEEEPSSSAPENEPDSGGQQTSSGSYRKDGASQGPWSREGAEEKWSSFATRFSEFVDEAVNRVKEFDFDFNSFASGVKVQHVFQHNDVLLREADIHIENGDIELRPWEENTIRIECDVQVYRARDEESARREFLQEAQFSFSNGKLRLESRKKSVRVNTVIYFPTGDLDKLNLYTFNGKMRGEHIPVHHVFAKAVNGRLHFDRLDAKEVQLETYNGPVHIGRLHAVESYIKTLNGSVTVDAGRGSLHVESVNGSVHFRLAEASQSKMYVKTTTGSVHIAVPENVKTEGDLKATVGSIRNQLPNLSILEEKKEFANKKMTFLSNKDGEGHFYIEAEASTGSVHLH
ncbi:DUF4097 family beta strand repeat-containing protein [Alkalicoccus urumqiensis]|uniref:DUF4097 domain-containing protein n=1 Tax=Alkalicoccus urumqiensis TaxID=1548213 RepID=A0A2P6MH52_ALKUR|nr:DUF4097 domain-containing protein [Alkalicoccus urumqiensis]PRO65603.1 DUF4097 domain-containing protein [Alkalicoccus urumqiensis]